MEKLSLKTDIFISTINKYYAHPNLKIAVDLIRENVIMKMIQ